LGKTQKPRKSQPPAVLQAVVPVVHPYKSRLPLIIGPEIHFKNILPVATNAAFSFGGIHARVTISGNASVHDNTAVRGGGVHITGSFNYGNFRMGGGTLNSISGEGRNVVKDPD
jgi:hypothetical protein